MSAEEWFKRIGLVVCIFALLLWAGATVTFLVRAEMNRGCPAFTVDPAPSTITNPYSGKTTKVMPTPERP